jgi:hypothetical protein
MNLNEGSTQSTKYQYSCISAGRAFGRAMGFDRQKYHQTPIYILKDAAEAARVHSKMRNAHQMLKRMRL